MSRRTRWIGIPVILLLLAGAGGALVLSHTAACPAVAEPAVTVDATRAQAYTYACYGGPEVLRLTNIAIPTPADTEVVVQVRAASVNPLDWHFMRGEPYVMRVSSGLGTPNDPRLGVDFAGVVASVGSRVTEFRVGDRVFGERTGAFATHVVVREAGVISHMPDSLSFDDAAAAGVAAITALQALRDKAHVRAGQRVLINGASGGVGTYAVQIAKNYGAHVTGVASTRNLALVQSLGADRVIDYTKADFTAEGVKYDAIIDMVGNHTLRSLDGALAPGGIVVIVGGPSNNAFLGPLTRSAVALVASPVLTGTFANFLSESNKADLVLLRDWLKSGTLRSVIDRRYPFAELSAAIAYQEAGRSRGKVIVQMP
ncbi:MAG: NAD(P)-dependent alcohol dehydrogenase [Gemmatimonadaceae bacterium]|nr:NAD(P)-dependent alcohol dehydrogenase [Gemmatimonadaceae bacterium]